MRDLGMSLGVGEDAAQKRVAKALQGLTDFFRKRGFMAASIATAAAALKHTSAETPPAAAAHIARAASQVVPPSFLGMTIAAKFTALTTVQKAVVCAVLLAAAPLLWLAHGHSRNPEAPEPEMFSETKVPVPTNPAPERSELRTMTASAVARQQRMAQQDSPIPQADYWVHLTGLVDLLEMKAALLEIRYWVTNADPTNGTTWVLTKQGQWAEVVIGVGVLRTNYLFLQEGQSSLESLSVDKPRVRIELLGVDSGEGKVQLREGGPAGVYGFDVAGDGRLGGMGKPNIRFEQSELGNVMLLYGELRNRTLLAHPASQATRVSLATVGFPPG